MEGKGNEDKAKKEREGRMWKERWGRNDTDQLVNSMLVSTVSVTTDMLQQCYRNATQI